MEDAPSVPNAANWFVYILECGDGSYYVGFTCDLQARFEVHQSGRGPAYTAARLPVSLAFSEQHSGRAEAIKREKQLKGCRARQEGRAHQRRLAKPACAESMPRVTLGSGERPVHKPFSTHRTLVSSP